MKILIRIVIPLFILAAGWFAMDQLAKQEEPPTSSNRRRENLPKVRVAELERSNFQVTISSQGVVRAHNSTSLTPRVSGRIHHIDPKFEEGAFFQAGDVLVELDPTDFQAAIAAAEAGVARAEAALAQEEARAKQALLDWEDLGYEDDPSPLVLREPQLKQARADLAAAEAELSAANRDYDRSKVLAPYDGCVLRRLVAPGQSVNSGSALGEIFSTDYAEIRLPLTAGDLAFAHLPEERPDSAIDATLFDALTAGPANSWESTIVRTEGALDTESRKLFVVARVVNPYGLGSDQPPLRVGLPVRAEIEGKLLEDVFVLPRQSLRNPTEILLVNPEDRTLARTQIDPLWSDENHVVVRDDLPPGWLLVVSQLSYPADGAEVEILEDPPEGAEPLEEVKAAQGRGKRDAEGKNTGA